MMRTPRMCQTLCWVPELQRRQGHSLCLGVYSLVGEKNTYNKNPHMILGYEDGTGHWNSLGWGV